MYSTHRGLEKLQLALLDGAVVFCSALIATWMRHGLGLLSPQGPGGAVPWIPYLFPAALVAALFVVLFRFEGLYRRRWPPWEEALRLARGSAVATMAALTATFFYRGYSYSRATALLFFPLCLVLLLAARALWRAWLGRVPALRAAGRRVLIVGFGSAGRHLAAELLADPAYYRLVGFLDDDPRTHGRDLEGVPVLGATADLKDLARQLRVDEVLVALPSAPRERVLDLVGECLRLKLSWKVVPDLCGLALDRVRVDEVGGLPLVGLKRSPVVGLNWVLKRSFDVLVSSLLLVLFAPLLLLIALAIRASSRGPVLFRQTRSGLLGRPFTFLKFRTMRWDNDPRLHQDYTAEWIYGRTGEAGPADPGPGAGGDAAPAEVHKIVRDPRVTRLGRLLRRTSLDEMPQLWNVLRGDMSLVGPRPPLPYEVERYTEWHKRRLEVLPGITGLWQVSGRNALSFEEMVRLDIEYIETWSLEQDIRICLRTLPSLLFGSAY